MIGALQMAAAGNGISYISLCAGCHGLDGNSMPNTVAPMRDLVTKLLEDRDGGTLKPHLIYRKYFGVQLIRPKRRLFIGLHQVRQISAPSTGMNRTPKE
jgi:hypothetical protein